MAEALMALGSHFFYMPAVGEDTPNFETVSKESTATWISQGRLSRDNAMQFTGPGEESITVQGVLYPEFFDGLATLENIRTSLRAGKPLKLIRYSANPDDIGYTGEFVGNFVIRKLQKSNSKFTSSGTPRKIEFTIDLCLYGDDLSPSSSTGSSTPTTGTTTTTTPDASSSVQETPSGTTLNMWAVGV